MCGIVGVFSKTSPASEESLRSAIRSLHHRGPDGCDQWISSSGRVALGHTRLSIIDLVTGAQPLSNENGMVHAVVNGEFYDFVRIRSELAERGHHFKTRSDSEILLHLYEELGANCVHELRGEFAFALWDEASQTLFAGRDRFGIKPLYYAWRGDTLYLASEVKALFAAGVPARWDHESFFQFNSFLTYHQDRTPFEGVYQVPPGHYLLVSRNHTQLLRYWDFDNPIHAISTEPRDQAVELMNALDEAVRLRMHADVPIGCYLSGGIDSCAVLGLAARHSSTPVKAFTLSFDHENYDELPIAKEMAAHVRADFHPIHIRQEDLAENFADAVWHSETMFVNGHGIAKFLLSRAVHEIGYKVVLTGEGSDDILAGYPYFRADMVKYAQLASGAERDTLLSNLRDGNKVPSGLLLPQGQGQAQLQRLAGLQRVLGFVPSWMEVFAALGSRFSGLFSDSFANQFNGRDAYRCLLDGLDVRGQIAGRDVVHQVMYMGAKTHLPNYLLSVLGDRMEMAHSVEGRLPFLDHRVVELVRGIPISQKIHGTTEKYVLREAMRSVLTDTVYRRPKHPFLAPPALFNPKGRLNQLIQDTLRGSQLRALPFYDPAKVVALLDKVPAMDMRGQLVLDTVFTGIASACLLQERFALAPGG